jgi:hypothetical protein
VLHASAAGRGLQRSNDEALTSVVTLANAGRPSELQGLLAVTSGTSNLYTNPVYCE